MTSNPAVETHVVLGERLVVLFGLKHWLIPTTCPEMVRPMRQSQAQPLPLSTMDARNAISQ